MKTVFKSDEIAHIWANRGAPCGRSPGNASFDGDAFKSYATVIGRRITHGGKVAYVLDSYSFSNSTSKVSSRMRCAIPDGEKVFRVHCGERGQSLNFTPASLAKHFEDRAERLAQEMPSRYAHKRAEQYAGVTGLLESARDVLAFFDMGTARLDKKISARLAGQGQAEATMAEYRAKLLTAQAAKEARELKDRTARNIKAAQDFIAGKRPTGYVDLSSRETALDLLPEDLRAQFVQAVTDHNSSLTARWLAGGSVDLPHDSATLLRVEADEMVTSRGARVPLKDARKTYRFAVVSKAKGWHRNGETHAIGAYQLDAVNENGVVAGCHRVSWTEIERFAKAQGWVK